jgi:hypothetical protein
MVRVQVQFSVQQLRSLREVAARRGVSIAEVVRQAVDRDLERDERRDRYDRALSLIGHFTDRDQATDVAENHDRYLDGIHGEGLREPSETVPE